MADEQAAQVEAGTVDDAEQAQSDSDALGEGGKRALEAERKARAEAEKSVKALQEKVDALSGEKLSETERLQQQIDALISENKAAQLDAARNRVAATEGIPAKLVPYLTGDDEASLLDSAKAIKSAIAEAAKPGTPAPDPSQGATGVRDGGSTADQFASFVTAQLR